MYAVLILLLAGSLCSAQFSSLATNDDGSILYFVSSLKQKGTDQPAWGKAFRADSSGVQPYSILTGTYYDIGAVDTSGDGQTVSVSAGRDCNGFPSDCRNRFPMSTVNDHTFTGDLRLSPNGRYGLAVANNFYQTLISLVDPVSGAELVPAANPCEAVPRVFAIGVAPYGRVVSDTGVGVFGCQKAIWVISQAGARELVPDPRYGSLSYPVIDALGNSVYYIDSLSRLRAKNLATGTETVWTTLPGGGTLIGVSNDGTRALLQTVDAEFRNQFLVVNASGASTALIADVVSPALSGDGRVCWARTLAGQILRLDLSSGRVVEVVNRTPMISSGIGGAPGSVVTSTGIGLAGIGLRLRLGDRNLPISSITSTTVTYQVPWDLPLGSYPAEIETDYKPDFVQVLSGGVQWGAKVGSMANSDFSSIVDEGRPAKLGEIVHLYVSGLGPVQPPIATGVPAPLSPLSYLEGGLRCVVPSWVPPNAPIETEVPVYFAGLAPGTLGWYQVSVRLPDKYENSVGVPSLMTMECTGQYARFSAYFRFTR